MFMFIHVEAHREDTLAFRLHYGLFLRLAEWVAFVMKKKSGQRRQMEKSFTSADNISDKTKSKNDTLVGSL